MGQLRQIIPVSIIVLLMGVVGRMDYEDHVKIEQYKCEQQQGTWTTQSNGDQYCAKGEL
ncbi:hypothetical protein [Basfia succiniciproducens]|uniref:hypothetical protein n=1 Tax=Basfia succiniciproducens TaxID=653940 RepID=UPI0008C3F287|nr:hypothetical protein [Basfia succiniciproducens]SEP87322.1 hypothetical protein SAMN02910415_00555 [Basfia succiniciproducens]